MLGSVSDSFFSVAELPLFGLLPHKGKGQCEAPRALCINAVAADGGV